VLRRIFRPLRDEVTWEWRRLYNEELYDLYSSTNIMQVIKSNEMERGGGHVTCTGDRRGAYRVLVVGREGKTPLGIPRHRWWNNIKMYLQ